MSSAAVWLTRVGRRGRHASFARHIAGAFFGSGAMAKLAGAIMNSLAEATCAAKAKAQSKAKAKGKAAAKAEVQTKPTRVKIDLDEHVTAARQQAMIAKKDYQKEVAVAKAKEKHRARFSARMSKVSPEDLFRSCIDKRVNLVNAMSARRLPSRHQQGPPSWQRHSDLGRGGRGGAGAEEQMGLPEHRSHHRAWVFRLPRVLLPGPASEAEAHSLNERILTDQSGESTVIPGGRGLPPEELLCPGVATWHEVVAGK